MKWREMRKKLSQSLKQKLFSLERLLFIYYCIKKSRWICSVVVFQKKGREVLIFQDLLFSAGYLFYLFRNYLKCRIIIWALVGGDFLWIFGQKLSTFQISNSKFNSLFQLIRHFQKLVFRCWKNEGFETFSQRRVLL